MLPVRVRRVPGTGRAARSLFLRCKAFPRDQVGVRVRRKAHLLPAGRAAKPFFVLQSLETPQLAFPVVRAEELSLAFRGCACVKRVSADDLQRVAAATPDDVSCWVVVAIPSDGSPLRLNLRAPLIVNEKKQLAAQVILGEECAGGGKSGDLEVGKINGADSALPGAAEFPSHPVAQSPPVRGQSHNLPVTQSSSVVVC